MLEKIGKNDNSESQRIIESFYNQVKDVYDGFLYAGYPIYNDMFSEEPVKVDSILISNRGVLIIHITQQNLVSFEDVQDNLYNKIEVKMKSYKFLLNKRSLLFDLNVVSVCENTQSTDNVVKNARELVEYCQKNLNDNIEFELVKKINSAVQEAYGLGKRENIDFEKGTKSELISNMNNIIETHDTRQMEAILADPVGIQRIRGMAGSGKTIVLARKAVELHTAHPEWKILVTYNTRSVKPMLQSLIDRLYRKKNNGQKPNYDNLIIMHGWGSASSPGFYYYLCKYYNVETLNLNQAKMKFGSNRAFEGVCNKLLKEITHFKKLFDCILIDEAQDFPVPFFRLCLNNLDQHKRLVYAYDELQKLNEEAMPTPNKIFNCDIEIDTPLKVSYRNQSSVIVTAHAIGMGIYRDLDNQNENLVQIPESNDIWEVIGYESDNEVRAHQEINLYRTKETSPDYLNTDVNSLVKIYKLKDNDDQYEKLIELIRKDIAKEKVPVKEVMIIDMDTLYHKNNYSNLKFIINGKGVKGKINVHLAGTLHPEDFSRDDSIVYSSILRAKGNETFVVYIVNSQESMSNLSPIKTRNELFTAITRSKGWVNILGYGEKMQNLENEFNKVTENNYQLYFKRYPSEEEKKKIRTTNIDLKKEDVIAIDNMEKLLKNLPKDKFNEIMEKFNELKKDL
ncbi:DEAD/DEAH box helicase [Bacillus sp. 03113]|uniref:DEAD/DEAH box helicase n=1 Tax=Bacillus sp. 03113 TaxID=2578211 RepID=UPI001143278A|nr:ATP-binding domain-containing protein [Bacillus sp. 03113]